MKGPTRVQLLIVQSINVRFTPGRVTVFFENSAGRSKKHATRTDTVSTTKRCPSYHPQQALDRVDVMKRPQRPYPRLPMDWDEAPAKYPATPSTSTAENSNQGKQSHIEQATAVRSRRLGAHARCPKRSNLCDDVSLHDKRGSTGAPNLPGLQPGTRTMRFLPSS